MEFIFYIVILVLIIIFISVIINVIKRKIYKKSKEEFSFNLELVRKEAFSRGEQHSNAKYFKEIKSLKERFNIELEEERRNPDLNGDGKVGKEDLSVVMTAYNKDKHR